MDALIFVWNASKVALGIGFVIFIHELGHFLLAKWNGVKVERFSIGFGPTLVSFRRGVGLRIGTGSRPPGPADPPSYGETEYVIAALPLGGYVKMLGESVEEQVAEADRSADPRAFHNKPVGGRMAIITAGVIMNLILGFLCFSFVHTRPGTEIVPRINGVMPGSPAMLAGLRQGDEIVAADGERNVSLQQVVMKIRLSGAGDKVNLRVRREGEEAERSITIEPRSDADTPMPAIGIVYPASGLRLAGDEPFTALPGQDVGKAPIAARLKNKDEDRDKLLRVVAVGPEDGPLAPVTTHAELVRRLDELRRGNVSVEVERTAEPTGSATGQSPERFRVPIPPHRFVGLGLQLAPGPITAIEPDSPASRAGLRVGDRIVAVAGDEHFDPMRLPDIARDRAGAPLVLQVERTDPATKATTREAVTLQPTATTPWSNPIVRSGAAVAQEVPGLGLALLIDRRIQAVEPGSPAEKAGLKAGDTLKTVTITPEKTERISAKPVTFGATDKGLGWPSVFDIIQENPVQSVALLVDGRKEPITLRPVPVADWYHPARGLNFLPETRPTPPAALGDALRLGAADAWDNVTQIFKVFRSLAQKRVGPGEFSGLIPIVRAAYGSASAGFTTLVYFLGFLSIQLAVLNFLPIPPLDGGQFLFLAAEKIRGRPLPEAALNFVTLAGVILVLTLIVSINVKDIVQWFLS